MEIWKWVFVGILYFAAFASTAGAVKLGRGQPTERISGSFPSFYQFYAAFASFCADGFVMPNNYFISMWCLQLIYAFFFFFKTMMWD